MKRGMKFFLLIGFACLAIGIIGSVLAFKETDLSEGVKAIDLEQKVSATSIDTLTIYDEITGVTFIPGDTDEIKVHLTGTVSENRAKDCTIEAVTEGSAWNVNVCEQKSKFHIGVDINEIKALIANHENRLKTEVTLPSKMFKEISVSSSTGTLDLKNVKAEKLTASTNTGRIVINSFTGTQLDIDANTGSITVDSFNGNQLRAHTSTGRIAVGDGQGEVNLSTNTGSITAKLHDIGDSVELESNTGSINLQLTPAPKSASFDLSSDTGRVSLAIPGVTTDDNERHAIKGSIGDGSKQVKVQTDTGSVSVTGQ